MKNPYSRLFFLTECLVKALKYYARFGQVSDHILFFQKAA